MGRKRVSTVREEGRIKGESETHPFLQSIVSTSSSLSSAPPHRWRSPSLTRHSTESVPSSLSREQDLPRRFEVVSSGEGRPESRVGKGGGGVVVLEDPRADATGEEVGVAVRGAEGQRFSRAAERRDEKRRNKDAQDRRRDAHRLVAALHAVAERVAERLKLVGTVEETTVSLQLRVKR